MGAATLPKPDFSGYATKAGIKCSDGRVITPDAFKHQDTVKVPLVWQHLHNDIENVLGYAILKHMDDGMWIDGYFNDGTKGSAAKAMVKHGDLDSLSIWANQLLEKVVQGSKQVLHGAIREVSLVLSGANPEAKIKFINLAHGDGSETLLDDLAHGEAEAIISMGIVLEKGVDAKHSEEGETTDPNKPEDKKPAEPVEGPTGTEGAPAEPSEAITPETPAEGDENLEHGTLGEVLETFNEEQNEVLDYLVRTALAKGASTSTAAHSTTTTGDTIVHTEGNEDMSRKVFEGNGVKTAEAPHLSHDQIKKIIEDAPQKGSFKTSFLAHAPSMVEELNLAHNTDSQTGEKYGIEDIEFLFPEARNITTTPEFLSRRQEWVANVLGGVRKSPFSRIKSTVADITADEARAKGYVRGDRKKDEVIKLLKRVTTPKTIYKKQKLDRDDIVDIVDFDVVIWLKAEMRLMLDEELARAILIGDGREPDDEDKIDEDHIRPIAYDDVMYAHVVTVPGNLTPADTIKSVLRARTYYKGTGTPTFYTTDPIMTDMILLEDKVGRRLYETVPALANAMRVKDVVPVEVMQDNPDLLGIVVNLVDYTVGADKGGEISLFEDFDIDFNQEKYLIETRVSGALTKPKSALVIKRDIGTSVVPTQPTYNPSTHVIAIPTVTGVVYKIDGVTKTGNVTITEDVEVESFALAGYSFPHNINTSWFYAF